MAGKELQVDDDYCKAMGNYYEKEGQEIESFLTEYVSILERIKKNAIKKGEVSNTLSTYITYAKKLRGQVTAISKDAKNQTGKYIDAIDEADKYLF